MENSTPGSPARLRGRRPVNPLFVAIGAVLLAAGGTFGWNLRTSVPAAQAAPGAPLHVLDLERWEDAAICDDASRTLLRDTALQGADGAPGRLADYLPKKSPIPGYDKVRSGALDPSGDTDYLPGAVEGHVAGFRPEGAGGFDVYAYRFLTRPAAAETIASAIAARACSSGAATFVVRDRPGMVVVREGGGAGRLSAWRLTRSDVVLVTYEGWGDADADAANLSAVVAATTPSG